MEVTNMFETRMYELTNDENGLLIKKWLEEGDLQLNKTVTN